MKLSISNFKRGNVGLEVIFIIVVMFIFGIIIVSVFSMFHSITPEITEAFSDDTAKSIVSNYDSRMAGSNDMAIGLMLVLFWVGALISAFFIDTHPAFFIVAIFLLFINVLVAAYLANAYIEIVDDIGVNSAFPISYFIWNHMVEICIAIITSVVIALYAKLR